MQSEYVLQNFVAAFLDVMGQRERLRKLDRFPETKDEEQAAIEILRSTLGVVVDIREKFEESIAENKLFTAGDVSKVPPEARHLFEFELKTFSHGFSDSFVLAVPLEEPESPHKTLAAIFSVIAGAGAMMLDALSQGRPLRGGIDLAPGIRLASGELYGPALAQPYVLESSCVNRPGLIRDSIS